MVVFVRRKMFVQLSINFSERKTVEKFLPEATLNLEYPAVANLQSMKDENHQKRLHIFDETLQ